MKREGERSARRRTALWLKSTRLPTNLTGVHLTVKNGSFFGQEGIVLRFTAEDLKAAA